MQLLAGVISPAPTNRLIIERIAITPIPNDKWNVFIHSAYGPSSRFGFIYDVLGFEPAYVFDSPGSHGNIVSAELLIVRFK